MLFVPGVAVGAVGMPLRFGDSKDAFKAKLVATSDVFAFKLSAVFTSVVFALVASAVFVASALKS